MANRYWVGGTGSWSDTAHWSTSSGGSSGAAKPTSSDDVFFDANSFTSTNQTVSLEEKSFCKSMAWTGATNSPTLDFVDYELVTDGASTTFISGMSVEYSSNAKLTVTNTTNPYNVSLTSAGQSLPHVYFFGFASETVGSLADNLTCAELELECFSFASNSHSITTGDITIEAFTVVNFGSSSVIVSGFLDFDFYGDDVNNLTASSASFTMTGQGKYFYINAAQTIGTLTINDDNTVYMVDGTVNNLNILQGTTITFDTAFDTSLNLGNLTANGTASSPIIFNPSDTTVYTFSKPSGTVDVNFCQISHSTVTGGATWQAVASLDVAENTGWNFIDGGTLVSYMSQQSKRNVVAGNLISWRKDFRPEIILFTIGVSSIGGNDIIAPSQQIDSQWNKYLYFDESDYITSLEWEQGLQLPAGGIRIGMAEGELDNTSGRFTPRYMGGSSELFTAILPRRPFILNAGFEDQGVESTSPQFVGLFNRQPRVDLRNGNLSWVGKDFVDFLANKYVDDEEMFTGYRSDQLIEQILQDLGFTTGQYDLDYGINVIPFAIFKRGERFGEIIDKIVKAEYGNFYQDEEGTLRFENRQHWDSSPHDTVQWEFMTSQVIDANVYDEDHIINVVEVKADVREKQPAQTVFTLNTFDSIELPPSTTTEAFIDFTDPILAITTPTNGGSLSFYKANTQPDGSGTDSTSSVTIVKQYLFSNSVKFTFNNSSNNTLYVTELVINGRPAKVEKTIYYRAQDDSSVTAFEEQPYVIENDYIQSDVWAESLAQLILNDFAEPENLQTVVIRAIPQLKLGDLVSWQGRLWRVFEKSSVLNAASGFVQEVKLLQRTVQTYFRIGISTIGSADKIAP